MCRLGSWLIAVVVASQVVAVPPAPAATAPALPRPSPLSKELIQSLSPSASELDTIAKYVKDNVARLCSADPDAATSGRVDLISATAAPVPQAAPSAVFLQQYVTVLARELETALGGKCTFRMKVNIGIVAARVADNARTTFPPGLVLQKVILTLMKDPSDAVALWGMKAAGASLNASGQGAALAPLLAQVIPTVQAHKLAGPITEEAYLALQDYKQPKVIETLIKLYEMRLTLYKDGVPKDPAVDHRASAILTVQAGMWSQLSAKDRTHVMSLIADHLTSAGKAIADKAQAENVEQFRQLIAEISKAVYVVANGMNNADLSAVALRSARAGSSVPVDQLSQGALSEADAIRKAFP